MPRFVILRHETPGSERGGVHWDLMLERSGVLRTWALAKEPAAAVEIGAIQLADHRMTYLSYQGPISGDRGSVTRWDSGEYQLVCESADELRVTLAGERLVGAILLERKGEPQRWTLTFST